MTLNLRMKCLLNRYALLVIAPVFFQAGVIQNASANTEAIIQSIHDGQNPYMVVVADEEGSSRRAPGIYFSNREGKWEPLIEGSIVTGGAYQGILHQLALTKIDRRYASLAVVGEKLRLFQMNFDGVSPSSVITFGEEEGEVFDLQGNSISLPFIRRVEDISIRATPAGPDGQVVVVSIRSESVTPVGDGVTFAFFVNKGVLESPDEIHLKHSPIVLDYRFLTYEQLGKVLSAALPKMVVSRLALQGVSVAHKKDDSKTLSDWRQLIRDTASSIYELGHAFKWEDIPLVDVTTGEVSIRNLPRISNTVGTMTVIQDYDVLGGRDEIIFPHGYSMYGRINSLWKPTSPAEARSHIYKSFKDPTHFLIFINSELYFLLDEVQSGASKDLPPFQIERRLPQIPRQVSFVSKTVTKTDGSRDIYLFYSYENSSESKTVVYVVSQTSSKIFTQLRKMDLFNSFVRVDELAARSNFPDFETAQREILFDHLTPIQGTEFGYKQSFVPTSPLLNISLSNSLSSANFSFIQALEEVPLPDGISVYKKFDTSRVSQDQSGLFLSRVGDREIKIPGQLLNPSGIDGASSSTVFTKAVKLGDSTATSRISVVAMDAGFRSGLGSFKLVKIISSDADRASRAYFDPIVIESNFSIPFSKFKGSYVIHTRKKGSEQLTLLTLTGDETTKGWFKTQQGLNVRTWKLEAEDSAKTGRTSYRTNLVKDAMISEENLSFSEVLMRIRIDVEGNLYWVNTPEKNPKDSTYSVTHMGTMLKISPTSAEGRGIKFVSDEEAQRQILEGIDGGKASFLKFVVNRWRVFGKFDATKITGQAIDDIKKYQESSKSFPEAPAVLDEIADLSTTPQHEVYLVSEDQYQDFMHTIVYTLLQEKGGRKGLFHTENERVAFNGIDQSTTSQSDVVRAFASMRESEGRSRKNVLIGSIDAISHIGTPSAEDDDASIKLRDPDTTDVDDVRFSPHLMYLLATEGRHIELEDFAAGLTPPQQVSTIIVSTPAKWNDLKTNHLSKYKKYGLLNHFKVNKRFLAGSWKVWPPGTPKFSKETKKYLEQPISELEQSVFPNLNAALVDLADPTAPAKHKVLLVSKELKPLVRKLIYARWFSDHSREDFWNYKNPEINLYKLDGEKPNQETLFTNFQAMTGGGTTRRSVLVAELPDLRTIHRPGAAPGGEAFLIQDSAEGLGGGISLDSAYSTKKPESGTLPHILYLLETEGQKVAPESLLRLNPRDREVSLLLIGDAGEWEALKRDMSFEARFDLASRYETFALEVPTPETRRELLLQVIGHPEVRRLGYEFDASALGLNKATTTPAEAESKLIGYLVNRSETLAHQPDISQEVTSAYIKVLNAFRQALVEDPELRTAKTVDRSYLERLLSKIFGIPLNLTTLPPDDPYRILSDERAALKLQEAGYRGPLELKAQVVRTLLAPTRSDPTRAVPGSIVVFGESSTGKTLLFKTVMKLLKLKEYQFSNPNDEEASYMIVNVGRITSDRAAASGEVMTLEETLKNISHFLSMPKGFRGHILFDDMHKGDKDVVKGLIKFMQSLFDAERGMVRVERMQAASTGTKVIEIPVRNIHLWMTLNPTQDQDKLKRFGKSGELTDVDVVVATLSTDDNPVERSFLMRWGLVLNVSKFPLDAKAPALSDSLRAGARNSFGVQNKLILVTPSAVNKIVSQFPTSNAREFLSAATSQLLQTAGDTSLGDSLFVVVPSSAARHTLVPGFGATGRENAEIENYIRSSSAAIPVRSHMEGKLHLLSIMVDSLRTTLLESFINAATQDMKYAGGPGQLAGVLGPLLHGVTANLVKKDYLPWSVLNLDPADFILSKSQKSEFNSIVRMSGPSIEDYYDVRIQGGMDSSSRMKEFFSSSTSSYTDKNRAQVVREYLDEVRHIVLEYVQIMLRIGSIHEFPSGEAWLSSLRDASIDHVDAEINDLGKRLADLFLRFGTDMTHPSVLENRFESESRYYRLSIYDLSRLFAMTIDRAITQVPWGEVTKFMVRNLAIATSDMEIGQRPGVLHYLFATKVSILKPATHELVLQISTGSQSYKDWTVERKKAVEVQFDENCGKAFETSEGSAL